MGNDECVIKEEPSFSPEKELERLLKAYKDALEVFTLTQKRKRIMNIAG